MDLVTKIPFAMPQDFVINVVKSQSLEIRYWFVFSSQNMLISKEKTVPTTVCLPFLRTVYLGSFEGKDCFAAETIEDSCSEEFEWISFRDLHGLISEQEYALAGRALQLLQWDKIHTYCGACGAKTFSREHERCRECPSCGFLAYPKLAPAVMALVRKEDKILLARSPHFSKGMYSLLAGYLDVGETLEQCVEREVQEEVGIKVGNIRYFGSQPWPFTGSLMVGFTCDWIEGDIVKDPVEIEEANWFAKEDLPMIPTQVSLAYWMIESWKK